MGEEELNKLRGKVIGMHSNVITDFVGTSEGIFGQSVLKQMYAAFDADRNGTLEESELEKVLKTLGFSYLNAKQVNGIFERADADHDGHIDEEEWKADFPKTLRKNLTKLAKKNGGDMGLLS
jgi:Ca2+-binding EF-hand superfamily protein